MKEGTIGDEIEAGRLMGKTYLGRFFPEMADPEESAALKKWIDEHPDQSEVYARLDDPTLIKNALEQYKRSTKMAHDAFRELEPRLGVKFSPPIRSIYYYLAGIAASILLVLGGFFWSRQSTKNDKVNSTIVANTQDLAPGSNKAVLTLSNGTAVVLDSAHYGLVLQQGKTQITNRQGGQLAYDGGNGNSVDKSNKGTAITYNTVTTGRGGQYSLVLSDGTRIWLDAASSLRYPVSFVGARREVELNGGQAYFEVAPKTAPFIVKTGKTEIQVLGTAFNINAYPGEDAIRTTLLEGAVRVRSGEKQAVLHPGQQARTDPDGRLSVEDNVNTDDVIAWKNGYFQFDNADIETILRSVSRWYDVDVTNRSHSTQHFIVTVPRGVPVSVLMRALERTDRLHYRIDGKKLIIEP